MADRKIQRRGVIDWTAKAECERIIGQRFAAYKPRFQFGLRRGELVTVLLTLEIPEGERVTLSELPFSPFP